MLSRLRKRNPAWMVAGLVVVVYGTWLVANFWNGHDPRDFAIIDTHWFQRCDQSSLIHRDPSYHGYSIGNTGGYDGQFYYFIATDPIYAKCYVDDAAYRYTRILYPITAEVTAFFQPGLVPWTLILVNLLAIAGGTLALAMWLRRKGFSPWIALLYGFYPGLFTALWRDLTEPLSYGLVTFAVYLFDFGGKRRFWWAAVCFALAALARETAILFILAYSLRFLGSREWIRCTKFLLVSLLPFAVWKLWVRIWIGNAGTPVRPVYAPFQGLIDLWPWHGDQAGVALAIAVPAIVCLGMALWALKRRFGTVELASLLFNLLILTIFLPSVSWVEYYAAGRTTTGVLLAALFCIPLFQRLTGNNRGWLWVCGALWFMPWYQFFPAALGWIGPSF